MEETKLKEMSIKNIIFDIANEMSSYINKDLAVGTNLIVYKKPKNIDYDQTVFLGGYYEYTFFLVENDTTNLKNPLC